MEKLPCPGSKSTVTQGMREARKDDRFPCSYCGRYTKMHNLAGVLAAHTCDASLVRDHHAARVARAASLDFAKEHADRTIVVRSNGMGAWEVTDGPIVLARFYGEKSDADEYAERKRRIRAHESVSA